MASIKKITENSIEFLTDGSVTLAEVDSPINGTLTVKWDMVNGYQIMGGGLWQVGGPVEMVWKSSFKKLPGLFSPKRILIVGLGGGSIAKLARKKWPNSKIVGVDVDEVIVDLGKKYLALDKFNVETHIEDAFEFAKKAGRYDLICVDTYVKSTFPEKFESESFLKDIKKRLNKNGVAMFNRLYDGVERKRADRFEKTLEKVFGEVKTHFPYPKELVNIVFIISRFSSEVLKNPKQ